MKLRILIALSLTLSAAITRAQNIDTLPALTGAQADLANDKLLVRDASVTASAQALRTMTLQEYWKALGGTNVSTTELGYLDGVTSAIQTQLNGKVGYDTTNSVVVASASTDTARGTALLAAYAAAKLLTPNGSALSATNRAQVVIPPGKYKLTATLVLDGNFVDMIAMVPSSAPNLSPSYDLTPGTASNLSDYTPTPTVIYCETPEVDTVRQTASDVTLMGFTIAHLADNGGVYYGYHALSIPSTAADANSASKYLSMYFYHRSGDNINTPANYAVNHGKHVQGVWEDCTAWGPSWRNGENGVFTATMRNVQCSPYSIGGDATGASFGDCRLERCRSIGTYYGGGQGDGSFGGCGTFGIPAIGSSVFVECESGSGSFSTGRAAGGTYIRCRGGERSFGGTALSTDPGTFSGYAEDCVAGKASFGGTAAAGYGKCTGKLVRCIVEGNTVSMRLEGATIRDSRITSTTTGIHALTLLDSNSVISNSDIIVLQGGTGLPIYAASALNVAAYALRMNNATNDADGLGSNVTNLVTTPYNIISDAAE